MKSQEIRRDLVDKALVARTWDDYEQFDHTWDRMNRLEKALYTVEEWEIELVKVANGQRIVMTFTEPISAKEELELLDELEAFTHDPATLARIEQMRRTGCFCPRPYLDEDYVD